MSPSDANRMRLILALRQMGVTDARLLAALELTPRAQFVAPHLETLAWDDSALPIGEGQSMPKPSDAARMLSALALSPGDSVLEIGTGSGWQTAALARLCRRVVSLERRQVLADAARDRLSALGLIGVSVHWADGGVGWLDEAPYDRILVNLAIHTPTPAALMEQLRPGGVLAAPVGEGGDQMLTRARFKPEGGFEITQLGGLRYPEFEAGLEE